MKEKAFETQVKQFLADHGCWFLKYWSGNAQNGKKFTKDGVPDLLVCCNGYFMGIELKAEKGKPSELQKWNIEQIIAAGGFAFTLYPDQFEDFKQLIFGLNNGMNYRIGYEYVKKFNERWKK